LENFCGMISKLFHKSNSKRKILNFPWTRLEKKIKNLKRSHRKDRFN
jgi:hypothetical protein